MIETGEVWDRNEVKGENQNDLVMEMSRYLGWQRWCILENQGLFVKPDFSPPKIGVIPI